MTYDTKYCISQSAEQEDKKAFDEETGDLPEKLLPVVTTVKSNISKNIEKFLVPSSDNSKVQISPAFFGIKGN